jgi:outer membrane protein
MTSTFTRFVLPMALAAAVAAPAQTGTGTSSSPALPSAPSSAGAAAPITATGTKVGTIAIEQAIFATNEGRRDFEALGKKLEPKQTELKTKNDEIEALKKQLNNGEGKLSEDARSNLVKQVESKQKVLDREVQDAREDAQNQQQEIASRILQKMAPVLVKYAADNGFGVMLDTSQPWPQGPVIWWGEAVDVTKQVVDAYNAQSNVPPPATSTTPKPSAGAGKPAGTPAKPAATTPPKPQ